MEEVSRTKWNNLRSAKHHIPKNIIVKGPFLGTALGLCGGLLNSLLQLNKYQTY